MRLRLVSALALCLAALPLTACDGHGDRATLPIEEVYTLYVAPRTVACTGEGLRTCLLVRRDPNAAWQYFYDGIDGFTYEAGFDYTLVVASRDVPNPPADGSSKSYRLISLVAKTPAS